MNPATAPEPPLPDSIPCELLSYKAVQRECERRAQQCFMPRTDTTHWTDSKGQRYERLKSGQIVRVSGRDAQP